MDRLLRALDELRIHGTEEDEAEFRQFQMNLLKQLRKEEIEVLEQLDRHHTKTFRHSLLVARDTEYIARHLGLRESKVKSLALAALLHDVGKLDIHKVILSLGPESERRSIWAHAHPGSPIPMGLLVTEITIRDIISYKASLSDEPKKYRKNFESWMRERGLEDFLDKSLKEYIQHHQDSTRSILESIGVKQELVNYAASHHLSYFDKRKRHKLPRECCIIEVADKFNAIIQSEGARNYISKGTRTEALVIISHEMRSQLKGFFKRYEKKALQVLVKEYLPQEVHTELVPKVRQLVTNLRHRVKTLKRVKDKNEREEASKMVALIAVTISVSKEFGHVLDRSTENDLEHYEYEIESMLKAA
ncbi:MAG: HD domain-containing protein [Candidatus Woesearchaeota archaeon]